MSDDDRKLQRLYMNCRGERRQTRRWHSQIMQWSIRRGERGGDTSLMGDFVPNSGKSWGSVHWQTDLASDDTYAEVRSLQ